MYHNNAKYPCSRQVLCQKHEINFTVVVICSTFMIQKFLRQASVNDERTSELIARCTDNIVSS